MNKKIQNKTSKPDNIALREGQLKSECKQIEALLPDYLYDYFIYLKNSVALSTRYAYLNDLKFFFRYLVVETLLTKAQDIKDISLDELQAIKAKDVNRFIGDYCTHYEIDKNGTTYIIENNNRSLSRKKSALSVFFKFLFREELIATDISTAFNPIKLPKPQPDAIKRLMPEEVAIMLEAVNTGKGLTKSELNYWQKTKLRDKAILILFTTYGLRLQELQQLNLSSINLSRQEFTIFRKRDKEVAMPINRTALSVLSDYINKERKLYIADDKDALFLSLQGKRMTVRTIRNLVKKYTAIALGTTKENGYSPHKLRATAASSLIEYGFSIYDVQNLLDHDNITTTQLYAAHKKNAKRDIVANYELLDDE